MATEIKILLYFFVLMALTFPWSMRFLVKTGVKLLEKYLKDMSKKKLVIAVDFNGTCVTYAYPEGTGEDIGAVPVLKRLIAEGHQLVLMTGIEREGEFELPIVKERWDDMIKWVEDNGLTFVGINRNPLEKYRSKKLTADIYIDDHCLGIPTIFDERLCNRPFVDWDGVEQLLEMMNVLPATPRTHFTVKHPSYVFG